MNKVREKIKINFDALEDAMKAQKHLDEDNIVEVLGLIAACSKYFRILDDEHRDYLHCVRHAVSEGMEWNVES
jgi:hypothetical protein